MVNINENEGLRLGFRLGLALISAFTILLGHILTLIDTVGNKPILDKVIEVLLSYRYFTMQSNLLVLLWLLLAVYYNSNAEKLHSIMGSLKGAITSYITVTFIVFALILAPGYTPTGFDWFHNFIVHYFMPIGFILDYFLFETKIYNWRWIPKWYIYPVIYLIFGIVYGIVTLDPIYPFFNFDATEGIGWDGVTFFSIGLVIFYFVLSVFYIGITKIKNKEIN